MNRPEDNPFQCQVCGMVYEYEVRYHSGTRECGGCWSWRKLDGPACNPSAIAA